ncbi:outer membrane protein [Bartonella sp. CB175]|uniref:outer membrane protein n=1 Tax=Bartonella sp. CB175 TaxID=3112256 RepID=UPI00300DE567
MNIKCLATTSVIALASISAVQASTDATVSSESLAVSPVVIAPPLSWSGLYFGAQIGGFSGETKIDTLNGDDKFSVGKDLFPKLSGFMSGFYAGFNIDLGNNIILGVDTDIVRADKDNSKSVDVTIADQDDINSVGLLLESSGIAFQGSDGIEGNDILTKGFTVKEKWSGATRLRLGFGSGRILPYVSGGVAYTQFENVYALSVRKAGGNNVLFSGVVSDATELLVGYTFGAGVDFAVSDRVILRAEYRYSDFGKKNFRDAADNDQDYKDTYDISYKTNDFRVGIAYKF